MNTFPLPSRCRCFPARKEFVPGPFMHKRISRHQVRLGMFIESIEGDWLSHPFWTRRFVLTNGEDLLKLRASGAQAVVIDESKGVAATPTPVAAPVPAPAPARPRLLRPAAAAVHTPQSLWAEREMRQCRRAVGQLFAEARLGRGIGMKRCVGIVDGIADALSRNAEALLAITRLKSVDAYTHIHSIAVSALMIHFGRHLGLDGDEVAALGQAGLLHDIGKMRLGSAILNKTGPLTPAEIEIVRTHPGEGHAILLRKGGASDTVLDVCLHHHERLDGSGYPFGLRADQLGHAVRIAAICDVYDAVTSLRPYKTPWHPEDAMRQMSRWHGHFDPALLRAFADCLGFSDVLAHEPETPADRRTFAQNGYSDPTAP